MSVTAVAHANIALVKYWGKRDLELNLPAVGSISLTLAGLTTRTTVEFQSDLTSDRLVLDGQEADPAQTDRVRVFLDRVRQLAEIGLFAEVVSENDFPTGAGLASSASGFAALALAATRAAGLVPSQEQLSRLARRGSGSAARSIYGGFVEMQRGEDPDGSDAVARSLASADAWPLKLVVALGSQRAKSIGSTAGMLRSAETSPYYPAWIASSPGDLAAARRAIRDRDLPALGAVAEHSCLKMHALTLSAKPPWSYWSPVTLEAMQVVRRLRGEGLGCWFTIDAGPQLKALCEPSAAPAVAAALSSVRGVQGVLTCAPGPGARRVRS